MTGLDSAVWGIDPSTRRIALAILPPGGGYVTRTLELGDEPVDARKLASARQAMVAWFGALAVEHDPGWLWVEQPFSGGTNRVHPSSWFMTGLVVEAAYSATGAAANLLSPTEWKKAAGLHGFARKRVILEWAQEKGFDGVCGLCEPNGKCKGSPAHDLADALGVAAAGRAFLRERVAA